MAFSSRRKLQVFVSSTYKDLVDDRQAAVSAILKAGHIPAGMELFNAGDRSQLETIKRWIDESDIFMLILGGRYGSLEPESQLSYTEVEYDYAVATKKPFFAVVIRESALRERVKTKGQDVLELNERQKLDAFRAKVESKICTYFDEASEIKLTVHESIPDLEQRHALTGWIRAETVPDATGLINEIGRLTQENQKLSSENQHLRLSSVAGPTPAVLEEQSLWETVYTLAAHGVDFTQLPYERAIPFRKIANSLNEHLPDEFSEGVGFKKHNMLGVFYGMRQELAVGLTVDPTRSRDQPTFDKDSFLLKPCVPIWSLEELVESESLAANGFRCQITTRGKKLIRLLDARISLQPGPSPNGPK